MEGSIVLLYSNMAKMDVATQSGNSHIRSGHVWLEGLIMRMRYRSDMILLMSRTLTDNNMRVRYMITLQLLVSFKLARNTQCGALPLIEHLQRC